LQELEFGLARVEARDFVSRRFQLGLQIDNLRASFRMKIRRGKGGFQIGDLVFRGENIRFHRQGGLNGALFDLVMKLKTLAKKIRRLEARLREGPKKLARLKRKLEAMAAAEARKAKRKAAARAGEAREAAKKVKRKRNLSPEGRAKLSAAMKARWAAKKAAA